ncbi:MAG TPA: AAA family ATPase, partial [Polyangiaceae bacterium]|nr:AAA family ATPase [Polyangiaceae bacterium]
MRFQRLDFGAFGPFTGLRLDLSGGAPGGFHIVFGPNEAGKSSALRGVHDLLFGFPERTPDAHVHPTSDLRIAAALSSEAGQVIEVQRLKRRKDALRDASDVPIDESVMRTLLGGVDAQLFERLFGLDHERLRRAGEALLEDRGDVGESLFDAGSGGRGIRSVLTAIEQGADEIFKPRSSKASLNVLIEAYKEARSATRDALVSPEKWLAQKEQLEAARSRLEELGERRKKLREESNAQSRLDAVLGPIAQRNALRDKLDALGALPRLAEDAGERRVRAQRTLDEAQLERTRLEREIAKKAERLAELVVPENLLGVSVEAIEKLRDRVGKFRAAEEDLPRRRDDARRHEVELQRLVSLLYPGQSLDALEALRPSQTELSRVRKLPQRQAALHERVVNVQKSVRSLAAQRAQAAASLAELPAPRELGVQRRVLAAARANGDIERRARAAQTLVEKLELDANSKLSGLGFWRGSLDALPGLELPSEETIDRFQAELSERAARAAELSRDHAALSQRVAQTAQKIQAIEGAGSVPSEAALAAARAHRDDGLRRLLGAWARGDSVDLTDREYGAELSLADSVAQAVKDADEHADRLRREAERVSTLAGLAAEREQLERELEALDARRQALASERAALEEAWRRAFRAADITPATPPEMRAWLARQRVLSELVVRLREARLDAASAVRERDALGAELRSALGLEAAADQSLGAMLAIGEEVVEAGTRAADRRKELAEALRDLERQQAEREQELATEREALAGWQVEWREATAKLGFPADLSPDEVVTRLDSLSGLFDGLVQLSEQRRRAARIEEDRAKFQEHVSDWVQTYAPDLASRAPDVAAEELVRRFQTAEHQRAEHAQLQADSAELTRLLSALEQRSEQAQSELDALRAAADATDLASLVEIEGRVAEARGLQRQLDAVEGSLLKDEGVPLEALLAAARGV